MQFDKYYWVEISGGGVLPASGYTYDVYQDAVDSAVNYWTEDTEVYRGKWNDLVDSGSNGLAVYKGIWTSGYVVGDLVMAKKERTTEGISGADVEWVSAIRAAVSLL